MCHFCPDCGTDHRKICRKCGIDKEYAPLIMLFSGNVSGTCRYKTDMEYLVLCDKCYRKQSNIPKKFSCVYCKNAEAVTKYELQCSCKECTIPAFAFVCSTKCRNKFEVSRLAYSVKCGKRCKFCKKETIILSKCSDCKCAKYCSKECQKLDWKIHKILCKDIVKIKNS